MKSLLIQFLKESSGSNKTNIEENLCQMQFMTEREPYLNHWAQCKQCPRVTVNSLSLM